MAHSSRRSATTSLVPHTRPEDSKFVPSPSTSAQPVPIMLPQNTNDCFTPTSDLSQDSIANAATQSAAHQATQSDSDSSEDEAGEFDDEFDQFVQEHAHIVKLSAEHLEELKRNLTLEELRLLAEPPRLLSQEHRAAHRKLQNRVNQRVSRMRKAQEADHSRLKSTQNTPKSRPHVQNNAAQPAPKVDQTESQPQTQRNVPCSEEKQGLAAQPTSSPHLSTTSAPVPITNSPIAPTPAVATALASFTPLPPLPNASLPELSTRADVSTTIPQQSQSITLPFSSALFTTPATSYISSHNNNHGSNPNPFNFPIAPFARDLSSPTNHLIMHSSALSSAQQPHLKATSLPEPTRPLFYTLLPSFTNQFQSAQLHNSTQGMYPSIASTNTNLQYHYYAAQPLPQLQMQPVHNALPTALHYYHPTAYQHMASAHSSRERDRNYHAPSL